HKAAVRVLGPFDADAFERGEAASFSDGPFGQHRPVALTALLLRGRSAQFRRPIGPGQRLVLALRRLRQDFQLRDRRRTLTHRGADAVRTGVAAADHDDVPAPGGDGPEACGPLFAVAGITLVLLRQEV